MKLYKTLILIINLQFIVQTRRKNQKQPRFYFNKFSYWISLWVSLGVWFTVGEFDEGEFSSGEFDEGKFSAGEFSGHQFLYRFMALV